MNFNKLFVLCLVLTGILLALLSVILIISKKYKTFEKFKFSDIVVLSISGCAFGFLGISIGVSMGLSNSPIVESIIPAILTFAGAFVSFILVKTNKDIKKNSQFIAAIGLMFLSFFIIKGIESGAESRILYNETHNKDGSLRENYQKEFNDAIISEDDKSYLDSLISAQSQKNSE